MIKKFLTYLSDGNKNINLFMLDEGLSGYDTRIMLENIKEAYSVNSDLLTMCVQNFNIC